MTSSQPVISICMTSRHRPRQLEACLVSLQAQVEAPAFELLVCANGDHDVGETVLARFPDALIVTIERDHPGAARNALLEHARGDLLLFLDDDIVADPHLLGRLAGLAREHREAGVFGGPNLSPLDSTDFEGVSGAVLASIVASGPVRRRYGEHPAGYADERFFILCNLAVRRHVMEPFREDLACAEENELLIDLSRRGVQMWYDPALVVYHARRPTMGGFVRQMWKYGFGRGQVISRDVRTARPEFLAPPLLLLYLLLLPVLGLVHPALMIPAGLYLLALVASAVKVVATLREPRLLPLTLLLTTTVHIFYGAGVVAGTISGPERINEERVPASQPVSAVAVPERARER
jgi:glycosyltransferase involved in cell wall biosynthesis